MKNKKACPLLAFLLGIATLMQVTSVPYVLAYFPKSAADLHATRNPIKCTAGTDQAPPTVRVYADKEQYTRGETVNLKGNVTDSMGNPLGGVLVGIEVDKPDRSPIFIDQQAANGTGWFETRFRIPAWAPIGSYKVTAVCSGSQGNYTFSIVSPAGIHDIAVTGIVPSKTVVGQGLTIGVNVTVANEGGYLETFNLTAYVNTTIINTVVNITLTSGNFIIVTFVWNTSGFAKGNYSLSGYAWPVLGEADIADNTRTFSEMRVTIFGDLNGDFRVNIVDIAIVARAFGSYPGHPDWNAIADIDENGVINILDVAKVAKEFGKTA